MIKKLFSMAIDETTKRKRIKRIAKAKAKVVFDDALREDPRLRFSKSMRELAIAMAEETVMSGRKKYGG